MQNESLGIFGEVLFDRFADGARILGGAPFNVAWHLQAFGQSPLFISRIGNDSAGDEIRTAMRRWGMSDAALQTDPQHPTGIVAVTISDGEPHYEILDNQAYDFIAPATLAKLDCRLLYHGSLALRHPVSRQALETLKSRHRGKVFMDVNLRAPWWDKDLLSAWMADADWVKLNDQELQQLLPGNASLESKMRYFMDQYRLEGLVVTLGSQGALAIGANRELLRVTPTSDVQIVDTVGAGDAFAAVLLMGIAQGWPLLLTMARAQDFASALVGVRGATVQNPDFYLHFVRNWQQGSEA
jgi:fructokinase